MLQQRYINVTIIMKMYEKMVRLACRRIVARAVAWRGSTLTCVVEKLPVVPVEGVVVVDVQQLLEGLHDEDERDERREALLRETRDVTHQSAQIKGNHQQQDDTDPQADPTPHGQVRQVVLSARIKTHQQVKHPYGILL